MGPAMRAEIISVGTELLLGEIANTNVQAISERLASIGVDVLFHTTVGDNEERIAHALLESLKRCDAVILTGGLGPTHDDVTREGIAKALGLPLEMNNDLTEDLKEWYAERGRQMPETNLRQCLVPAGAEPIPNGLGTAPGIDLTHDGKIVLAVPGVPSEMHGMLQDHLLARLAETPEMADAPVLISRNLRVVGIAEADVAEKIAETVRVLDKPGSPTVALYSSSAEVRIRITVKSRSTHAAYVDIFQVEGRLKRALGSAIYGADADSLPSVVAEMAADREIKLATAESFTGGALIQRLISVPDASKFVPAGFVTYSAEAKAGQLGVPQRTLDKHGTVAAETALAMAEGARTRAGATVGLSTTGEAGPDAAEQPVGTMFVALAWEGGGIYRRHFATGDREAIRHFGTQAALNLFRLWMMGEATDFDA